MKRGLLLMFLAMLVFGQQANAQRKGLNFSKEAYEKVPIATDEALGYTDGDLPAQVSYKQYAPYAGNQGDYGTCVGWSSAYGVLTMEYAKKMGLTDREQITFSAFCPYYIYNQFKEEYDFFCQSGGFFEDALDIMYTKGAKRYYLPEFSCYSDYLAFSQNTAQNFKISNYFRLFDWNESEFDKALGLESDRVENIKKALAGGHPVLIGMYVPGSFDYVSNDVWNPTQEERDNYNSQPGHAMAIVGYDDSKYGGAFEVMNSWGREWGNDGFVWIRYDDLDLFGHTAFYMDLGYKYYTSNGCQFGDCNNQYSRYKFETGEIYEGELAAGYFNGQGLYLWNNGEAFAGNWKNGNKHGKGIQMYADGSTLTGYWKDNLYYGTTEPHYEDEAVDVTTVVAATDTVEEETDFTDIDWSTFWDDIFEEETEEEAVEPTTGCVSGDCEDGYGKFIYSDGDIYEGYFKSTYRHGWGKYQYIEGDTYDGIWSWGDRHGVGYYVWPSGNEYIGFWSYNKQQGKGTKYYTNGTTEAGEWSNGAYQTGEATFGFTGGAEDEATQSATNNTNGLYFKPASDGKVMFPKHNQIPMEQNGFGGIPKSGLGTPMEDPYQKMADKVVSDILKGLGKADISNPRVNIINSDRDVAYTSKNTGIHVSTRFIDLCRSFGEDSLSALSVVLAHELGHYFKDHFFCRDFGYAYGETEWGQEIEDRFNDIFETGYFETQADEFGLFFSFVSGYDPFSVAAEVIGRVYDEFDLPEDLKGYPPKAARQEQVRLAAENVRKLIPLFEVGNLMAVLGSSNGSGISEHLLTNSSLCYEHIIDQKVTTAEMYNNLGVNYVNLALNMIEPEEFPFALPLELDFNSRLYAISEVGSGKGDEQHYSNDAVLKMIGQALSYFELAIKLDEDYSQAYNNSAACYILKGDLDEAWVKARKAGKLANSQDHEVAYRNSIDLLAIIAHENGETDDAMDNWTKAQKLGSSIAEHNEKVAVHGTEYAEKLLTDNNPQDGTLMPVKFTRPSFKDLEKIGDQSLYDIGQEYLYNGKPIETWQLKDQKAMVGKTEYEDGEFFIFAAMDRSRITDSYFFFFVDSKSDRLSSLEVANGTAGTAVETKYGSPANILSSSTHDYWVYLHKNIIFKMDHNNKVDGWILYDVNL